MLLKEKKLILDKYYDNLNNILLSENIFIKNNDYEFLENFLKDLLIINNETINYKFNSNFLINEYIINKYENIYKENYYYRKKLIKKYLKNDSIKIINSIKKNLDIYNFNELLYLFIIEYIKEINNYSNEINLNENEIKTIKRKMKNLIKYNEI